MHRNRGGNSDNCFIFRICFFTFAQNFCTLFVGMWVFSTKNAYYCFSFPISSYFTKSSFWLAFESFACLYDGFNMHSLTSACSFSKYSFALEINSSAVESSMPSTLERSSIFAWAISSMFWKFSDIEFSMWWFIM